MIPIKSNDYLSLEKYLELEENSEIKQEYIDGKIYAMVGETKAHNTISLNFAILLREHLKQKILILIL
ncbi:MAG: Uma2 family endonuclease [Crocosphaera sp.]